MNKDTFLQNLETSPISNQRKQEIRDIVEKDGWNDDTIELIKDIIQADIESDMGTLPPEDQVAATKATQELSASLATIEQTVAQDMAFVEGEMNDLESMTKDLEKTVDETQIDTLKEDITKSV